MYVLYLVASGFEQLLIFAGVLNARINDTQGHMAGDLMLKEVARGHDAKRGGGDRVTSERQLRTA